jgi:hypothetical protein
MVIGFCIISANVLPIRNLGIYGIVLSIVVDELSLMRSVLILLISIYYLSGVVLMPNGDLARLTDVPEMYNSCLNEDEDMDAFDFITDHLVNVDCIFDKHINDEQKPHKPIDKVLKDPAPLYYMSDFYVMITSPSANIQIENSVYHSGICHEIANEIFKPPRSFPV